MNTASVGQHSLQIGEVRIIANLTRAYLSAPQLRPITLDSTNEDFIRLIRHTMRPKEHLGAWLARHNFRICYDDVKNLSRHEISALSAERGGRIEENFPGDREKFEPKPLGKILRGETEEA